MVFASRINIPVRTRLSDSVLPDRYAELMNISRTGAYVATWHRFRLGDRLDLSTEISTRNQQHAIALHYVGEVVRVQVLDPRVHSTGVAVRFAAAMPAQRLTVITRKPTRLRDLQ